MARRCDEWTGTARQGLLIQQAVDSMSRLLGGNTKLARNSAWRGREGPGTERPGLAWQGKGF
jgi:hypothetical protein